MDRFITLRPAFQAAQVGQDAGFRLTITVVDFGNIPADDGKIFLCLVRPRRRDDPDPVLVFHAVCSPSNLVDWPPDEPDPSRNPSYCRRGYIDLLFPSRAAALKCWEEIQREVDALLAALKAADNLEEAADVTFGDAPVSSSSLGD